jgi:[ribosomal protein S18]-alanine N-acetyltransferase
MPGVPENFVCRPMQHSDLPVLAEFLPQVLSGNWSVAHLEAQMQSHHEFFVFSGQGSAEVLAGFAECYCVLDECHLLNFAIFKQWQRQGLAQLFLGEFLRMIRARGYAQCLLEVRRSNHAAVCLYEKNAFKLTGVRKNYYPAQAKDGADEDALLYSWSSSGP